ncbi:MAG: AsnC family protein, partial [Dissulfuribacterales bacterium]
TDLILGQSSAARDKHRAYRNKVQNYSDETGCVWEDVKFGLVFGSQTFIDQVKTRYLSGKPDGELPQLNRMLREIDPELLIGKAAKLLNCDLGYFRRSGRLMGEARDKRDVIVYLLWETGRYSNRQIGDVLGLSYSSVSRRITEVKSYVRSSKESSVKKFYDAIKTIIKV